MRDGTDAGDVDPVPPSMPWTSGSVADGWHTNADTEEG
jgi:hypothetical protein